MARPRKMENIFNPSPIKTKANPPGSVGYDNPRENIDPHIKTKVISTKEIQSQDISGSNIDLTGSLNATNITASDTVSGSNVSTDSLTSGSVLFMKENGNITEDSTRLHWDSNSNVLGVGNSVTGAFPQVSMEFGGGGKAGIMAFNTDIGADCGMEFARSRSTKFQIKLNSVFTMYWFAQFQTKMTFAVNGDLGLGLDSFLLPVEKFCVSGGNINIDKTSGVGIKTHGQYPWRDLLGDVIAKNTGATKPTFTIYRNTLLDYQFAARDEEYFKFHIPHDYVAGTDIHLHVHWSHADSGVTGGTVTFHYEISYSKGHNQAPFPASVSGAILGTASATRYQHILSEGQVSATSPSSAQIDSDNLEPDGVIIARLELRENNITVGEGTTNPFIHYVDIHYQSTNIGTIQKAPNFYL